MILITTFWDEDSELAYLQGQMQKISTFANGLNMPVIIGEYGAMDKDNGLDRETYLNALNRTAYIILLQHIGITDSQEFMDLLCLIEKLIL